jgi:flagellar biosynthesis/type III secretory pathway protein FliH
LPLVLYNGDRRWQAPLDLDALLYPAPKGLERYRPQLSYLLLDEGLIVVKDLSSLKNFAGALFQLENSRTEQDIQAVLPYLLEWLHDDQQTGLRRAFTVWFNRVLLPRKMPDTDFKEFTDLQEVQTMLAETVKTWANEARIAGHQEGLQEGLQEGRQQGRQEGIEQGRQQEAAKLFLLLLNSKFGTVSQELQVKIQQASPAEIEQWTKQIFQAETPETLLNS